MGIKNVARSAVGECRKQTGSEGGEAGSYSSSFHHHYPVPCNENVAMQELGKSFIGNNVCNYIMAEQGLPLPFLKVPFVSEKPQH